MEETQQRQVTEYLDVKTTLPRHVDLIFVFGTRFPQPALIAGEYLERQVALYVVLTGGRNPYLTGTEADTHCALLRKRGVPASRIIVENQSSNTLENVTFALPKIRERVELSSIRTVVAVAKWYHCRRAIMTLKRNFPTPARYFVSPYEPEGVPKAAWWTTSEAKRRVLKEWENIPKYLAKGDIAEVYPADGAYV